jgi:GNAT superfamily N-acetyltransferase
VATALEAFAARLPAGLRVRAIGSADIARAIEFANRFATPGRWQSPELAQRFFDANPQPKGLFLVLEDASETIRASGEATDGGSFAVPDGTFRGGVRVAEQQRRRGIGGALLAIIEDHARANGAPRLQAVVRGDDAASLAWALRRGYAVYHERIDAYLDLARVEVSRFEDPAETARRTGVRIASYAELAKERGSDIDFFNRSVWDLGLEIQDDIPQPNPMPRPPYEAMRPFFDEPAMDHRSSVVAIRGDRPVGITITQVKENGVAYTNITGVARSERGKGLATALKLVAIHSLRDRGVRLFGTTNDPANAAMRGINERLGYRPEPPTRQIEKKLR